MTRPREYDEEALVDVAMETFWSRGYDRTSVEDLVGRTRVNRASLYAAYPSKRDLFIAGLQRYLESVVDGNIRRLHDVTPASEAVRRFFLDLLKASPDRVQRGCLLINTAVELGVTDRKAAALIRGAFERVEKTIHGRLLEARKSGELREDVDPKAKAQLLMTVLQGLRVMGRVGMDKNAMRAAVDAALAGIGEDATRKARTKRGRTASGKTSTRTARS